MRSRLLPASALAACLVFAACSGSQPSVSANAGAGAASASTAAPTTAASAPASGAPTSPPPTGASTSTTTAAPPLAWTGCGAFQCAHMDVPLDYDDPSLGTISLYLKRRQATDPARRIGSLFLNPGGPGVPATLYVDGTITGELEERFDVVSWDPRGTGQSSPVDCVDDLDPYFSLDTDAHTDADKQVLKEAAQRFDEACTAKSGKLLAHVSTQDTARDMDRIREALGEDRISYFGFSYGSDLGSVYATLFPTHVRAMVLDGAFDPSATIEQNTIEQTEAAEKSLDALLADCAKRTACAFHNNGDPYTAFDRLITDLGEHPLTVRAGRPAVGKGIAFVAVFSALYRQQYWENLTQGLADAQRGDGARLLGLYDGYIHRGQAAWKNLIEDLIAINCLDDPGSTDPDYPDVLADKLEAVAPRLGRQAAYSYFCTYWPAPAAPPVTVTGKGAGPIVVVGTTNDPITPLAATRGMAEALEGGVLVTVDANQHTGYGANECVDNAVDRYLVDLTVPAAGLECKGG